MQRRGLLPPELRELADVENIKEPASLEFQRILNEMPDTLVVLQHAYSRAESYDRAYTIIAERLLGNVERMARARGAEKVTTAVVDGDDPATAILNTLKAKGADTVVMGRRGLGDAAGLLLGSVSHKVCQLSDATCVTVR